MLWEMKNVAGHIEVYDLKGRFLFSADTEQEAFRELDDMLEAVA